MHGGARIDPRLEDPRILFSRDRILSAPLQNVSPSGLWGITGVGVCVCVYHFTNFILKFLSDLKIVILGVNFVNDDIIESIFP